MPGNRNDHPIETPLRPAPGTTATKASTARRVVTNRRENAARARRLSVLRYSLAQLDAMDDRQFEFALRDLLIRDGWSARQVGQQGDQAADVIADHPVYGRLVVQAKHTKVGAKVGSQVMYQVYGTAGPVRCRIAGSS